MTILPRLKNIPPKPPKAQKARLGLRNFIGGLCLAWAMPAAGAAFTLALPGAPLPATQKAETFGSYDLPVGRYLNGTLPVRRFEGPLLQSAWRLDTPDATTLELLAPLRDQLQSAGFDVSFDCFSAACGGFDFRYNTVTLPEPEMHVDLGDFRFLSAIRGEEAISLLVSRSAAAGFVQMIHVGQSAPLPKPTTSEPAAEPVPEPLATLPTDAALIEALTQSGSAALEDLVFNSGNAALAGGDYRSLNVLAAWLRDNPQERVALVGHTDASGGLEANISLSRKRAEAVRQVLINDLKVTPTQILAEGVGYLAPRASNQTAQGREKNRRVEVMRTSTP